MSEWQCISTYKPDTMDPVLVYCADHVDGKTFHQYAAASFETWYEPEWVDENTGQKIEFWPTHWKPLTPPIQKPKGETE